MKEKAKKVVVITLKVMRAVAVVIGIICVFIAVASHDYIQQMEE